MHIGNRIAVILLVVLSSATASSGANYIRPEAASENGTTSRNRELGEVERQREPLRPQIADTAQDKKTLAEKKTLALLLLMLRDGRGAR